MRRLRVVLASLAVLVVAAALSLWLARDQPRRRIESILSQRIGAPVSIASLHVEGLESFRLEGVSIAGETSDASPTTIDHVVAEGAIGELNDGRFRALKLTGLATSFDLCRADGETATARVEGVLVAVLDIENAAVELVCGTRSLPITVSGRLQDLGSSLHGKLELSATAPHIPLTADPQPPSLMADGLTARIELQRDGGLRMAVAPSALRLAGTRELALGDPTIDIDAQPGAEGSWQLTASAEAPLLGNPSLQATVLRDPWRLVAVSGRAEGVAAGAIVDTVAPIPGVRLGSATLELTGSGADALLLEVAFPELQATVGEVTLCASATLSGDLGSLAPPPDSGLHARVTLASCAEQQPTAGSLDRLLPAVATVRAGLTAEEPRRLVAELGATGRFSGEISGRGWIDLGAAHHFSVDWVWKGVDLARTAQHLGITTPPELEIGGRLRATGRLVGDRESAHGRAELDLTDLQLGTAGADGMPWRLAAANVHSVVHWTGGRRIAVTLDRSSIDGRIGDFGPIQGELSAATELRLGGPDLAATELGLDLGRLGRIQARAERGASRWELHLVSDDLAAWPTLWPAANRLLPTGDSVTGGLTADGTLVLSSDGSSLRSHFTLHGGGYASADGSRVIAELGGEGELDLQLSGTGAATVSTSGRFGGLQLLWGTVYGDYSSLVLGLRGDGRWQPDGEWSAAAHADLGELATTDLGIEGTAAAARWHARLQASDLGSLWQQWLSEPCAGSLGPFDSVTLTSGAVDLVAAGELAAETTLEAVVQLSGLDVRAREAVTLLGLQLELPLALSWRDGQPTAGTTRRGSLGFTALELGGLHLPATASALSVTGDSLTLDSDLAIPLLGGRVRLEDIGLTHLLGDDRHLEAAVELEGLQLSRLSAAFDLPTLEGRLDGHFPLVRLSPDRLSVDGASELQLFGGSLILADIAGRDPLSRYPRLELAMTWDGIDLGQLTQTFDVGRITGFVEGEVQHCELFQGVPVTCAGWLRSTPRKGVEQRISLKAVNNIAIVGTGSGLGILDRGIHRLIDAYPYDSLGFSMDLTNDHFHLRGLARRGDAELFVKGRLPLRLDVVNARPGTTVSFRSMLARLHQLDFATIRTEAGHD